MIVSLRIMHFGFLISVMVAVLIIGNTQDASAQTNTVECPCDFESVPMTTGCWTEPFAMGPPPNRLPEFTEEVGGQDCGTFNASEEPDGMTIIDPPALSTAVAHLTSIGVSAPAGGVTQCSRQIIGAINDCDAVSISVSDISPEEVLACQCELLAYTTALNESGISVSGGPPYVCGNVNLRTCQGLPPLPEAIPTLNEWGMITTAGVLGLLAVIGLFVMRTRRTVAGERGPDGANQ